MSVLDPVLGLALLAMASGSDITEIVRRQRSEYNIAIAGRDLAAIEAMLTTDYAVLPGSSGTPRSRAELMSLFADIFGDASFDRYVRTPERIEVSRSGKRVAESGRWVGIWRKSDGVMNLSGIYQAVWVPRDGGWKLLNESFVTLNCTGSRECAAID